MIQRIQSLFLLGIVIISVVLFFVPLADYAMGAISLLITGAELNVPKLDVVFPNTIVLVLLNIIVALGAIIIVFLYQNRQLQIKLCRFMLLLNTGLIVTIFYFTDKLEKQMILGKADYQIGAILPLISFILLFMAIQAIRKDEALVKSADRLRD